MNDAFPSAALDAAGLNRQFVFDLASLPAEIRATLGDTGHFTRLILIGHAGRRLWEQVQASGQRGEHPIDDFTRQTIADWMQATCPDAAWRLVYPGETPIGLQALGELAGWHHASPMMIGIDAEWGTWFAYRAVVLTTFPFPAFFRVPRTPAPPHPCAACASRICVTSCPAGALDGQAFDLPTCARYRLAPESPCAEGCLARSACPVGDEHRYEPAQIVHSYRRSRAMLAEYARQWGIVPTP